MRSHPVFFALVFAFAWGAHRVRAAEAPLPVIRSVFPTTGAAGSALVITGTNFGTNGGARTVLFGNVPGTFTATDNRIEATVPAGLSPGGVPVVVNVAGNASNPFVFEVTARSPGELGLAIRRGTARDVIVSWPAGLTNALLQRALTVLSPWTATEQNPERGSSEYVARATNAVMGNAFYRLASNGSAPLEQLVLDEDWEPAFPIADATTATVSLTAGAVLRLKNGAVLEVPAGAVGGITQITFRELDLGAYSPGVSRQVYQVEPDNLSLKMPVQVTLPYRKMAGASTGDVHVFRTGASDGTTELPATINEAASTVRMATDHFSNLVVEDDRSYLETYRAALGSSESVLLPVPYYSQAASLWCFAAASQMMLKHYGRDVEIWDVARHFDVGLTQGAKQWRLWAGHYTDLFRAYGLEVFETCGWVLAPRIHGYVIQQLKAGRPVMVIVEASHAVVVVGYDAQGVFIHDPSGAAIQGITGQSPGLLELAARHFSWDEWTRALFPNLGFFTFPLPAWTIVLKGTPAPPIPTGTITLNTGTFTPTADGGERAGGGDLEIDRGLKEAYLVWDGRFPTGYWLAANPGFFPRNAANSDTMFLKVHAHNSGNTPLNATFRVELEGKTIATAQQTIGGGATSREVSFFSGSAPYSFRNGAAGVLFPGSHTITIEMRDGTRLLDKIEVLLEIVPAKPDGVKRAVLANGHKISWNPNPEEALTSIEYIIHANGVPLGSTASHEFTHVTSKSDIDYRVFAQHAPTKISGPFSEPATPVATRLSFVRDAMPTINIVRLGGSTSLSLTNLTVTETSASIQGVSNAIWKLSWNPPPPQVFEDDIIEMVLTPDAGGSAGQLKIHYTAPRPPTRSLLGDFGRTPNFDTSAMVRYVYQRACDGEFDCYNLRTQSRTNTVFVDFTFTGTGLIIHADGGWSDGNYGTIGAAISWPYRRVE